MKLAFSTLGCPDWTWKEITSIAKDLGYDAVEIRGIGRDLFMPAAKIFQPENIENTKSGLERMGLAISCLTSAVRLNEEHKIEQHIADAKEYIDVAAEMGIEYVRVIADAAPEPSGDLDIELIAGHLKVIAEYAESKAVLLLVETNGFFAKTEHMLKLLELVDNDSLKVLWDVHHPYRFYHEQVADTYAALKHKIAYLHIKDSVMTDDGKVEYRMLGHGDVPIRETVELLKADNFDGYLSLEWLKRWYNQLPEPSMIFPQYVKFMNSLLK